MTTKLSFSELLERAKTEKIAVHTPTEEQAVTLLKELDKRGYRWPGGHYISTYATSYENENTCYDFGMSKYPYMDTVTYEALDFYQKFGYTIIEFTDIDFKE